MRVRGRLQRDSPRALRGPSGVMTKVQRGNRAGSQGPKVQRGQGRQGRAGNRAGPKQAGTTGRQGAGNREQAGNSEVLVQTNLQKIPEPPTPKPLMSLRYFSDSHTPCYPTRGSADCMCIIPLYFIVCVFVNSIVIVLVNSNL